MNLPPPYEDEKKTSQIPQDKHQWTEFHVSQVVRTLGASVVWEDYARICATNHLDGRTMTTITIEDLIELQFQKAHARSVVQFFQEPPSATPAPNVAASPNTSPVPELQTPSVPTHSLPTPALPPLPAPVLPLPAPSIATDGTRVCRGTHSFIDCRNRACEGRPYCTEDCKGCPDAFLKICRGRHSARDCGTPACANKKYCVTTCQGCPDIGSLRKCKGVHLVDECGTSACRGKKFCVAACVGCPDIGSYWRCRGGHSATDCDNRACKGKKYCVKTCLGCPD